MAVNVVKDRRSDEQKELQKNYEEVLLVMKSITSTEVKTTEWTSKTTNDVIVKLINEWGVDETLYDITGEKNITEKASKLILIEDLLKSFSVNEIMILLYYRFDRSKYDRMMSGIIPEAVEAKYYELLQRLTIFVMGIITKFNIDNSILNLIQNAQTVQFTSQDQIRILWYNRIINIDTICKWGYLYSEEFTDYIIDHIVCKSKNIDNQIKKQDYLLNIYKLMDSRLYMYHSEMFKKKHTETISLVTDIQRKRSATLYNRMQPDLIETN